MTAETLKDLLNSNIASRFDVSDQEAERIAEKCETAEQWIEIWENEDWWTDEKAGA